MSSLRREGVARTVLPEEMPMHQHIAWTMRYLAGLAGQHTARTNAAEGSATLRDRRREQDDATAYLRAAGLTSVADMPGVRRDEQRVEHAL